jgi:hypothetical protein
MRAFIFTVLLMLVAGFSYAAGIDGKWEGTMEGGMGGGPQKLSYEFKANGNKLTGTSVDPQGAKHEIVNGKIEGNNVTFDVPVDMNGMKMTVAYKGVLAGDELKLTFTFKMEGGAGGGMGGPGGGGMGGPGGGGMPPMEITAKRVK